MAQADSKNSITASVDASRRRFLTAAAIGSAGSLAAVAMSPNDVPQAVTLAPVTAEHATLKIRCLA